MQSFVSINANKEDPTSNINMKVWVKLLKHSQKATDKTKLSLAVKYQHGYEYHTDNSQKLSKYKC